jgi:hypothetical protein
MGMFHSTSGKVGYAFVTLPGARVIPKGIMKQILLREDELRFSSDYHNKISEREDLKWIRDVTLELQMKALAEFGYADGPGLLALNNARAQYLNDDEMNKLIVYQRMDRSRPGDLTSGSELPNVKLSTLDGKVITLHEYLENRKDKSRPVVITAGSIT